MSSIDGFTWHDLAPVGTLARAEAEHTGPVTEGQRPHQLRHAASPRRCWGCPITYCSREACAESVTRGDPDV